VPADLEDLKNAIADPVGVRSVVLTGLFVLACLYTLYFARDFFLPVIIALFLSFLLWPIVRGLAAIRIPEPAGAGLVLLTAFAIVGFAGYELSGPVSEWLDRVPDLAQKLQRQVRDVRRPVEQVTKATERLTNATAPSGAPAKVEIQKPSLAERLFVHTWDFGVALMVVVVLLYFLLASGDLFLRKLIKVLPRFDDKKRAVQIAREIETSISRYLLTQALINTALGTAGGIAFWLLGMPNPALWGVLGAVLNFIPYLGALTTIGTVFLVAAATFPTLAQAALPPAAYLGLATLEGTFITPLIMGHRLMLNPVVVFVGLTFWGWLWGIPGALLAVPMLVMFKIFCDHIEPLAPVAEFLGK